MIQNHSEFKNPILPGFYPDPSICRVDNDYYLVTSTFTYFPGVPIFHSVDLVNWEQIGHVLDRPSQINLDGTEQSDGIYAPTIRYNKGIFYVITTNMKYGGNFIVTATDPKGPWSEPYWLENAPGIDPSLFFDDDGRCYYVGTRPVQGGPKYNGNWEIWLQELDVDKIKLIGEYTPLWRGAIRDVIWPEAPHIYKKDGYYYLLIAEGGTCYHHSVTVARSKNITGSYESNPSNPILTHRHLGRSYRIRNPGHADLVETQNGEWWAVLLASRPYGGYFRNIGRETFLVPVIWEDGWPIMTPGTGKVEFTYKLPDLKPGTRFMEKTIDDFDSNVLDYVWNFIRTPKEEIYSLTDRKSNLRLRLRAEKITELSNPGFVGRRQQHIDFKAATLMEFSPKADNETAGIVLIQNNKYHFRFEYSLKNCKKVIRLIRCENGAESLISEEAFNEDKIYLEVSAKGQDYSFYYGGSDDKKETLAQNVDGRILSTDVAGGFIGAYIGMYASSQGDSSTNYADFDWFLYEGNE